MLTIDPKLRATAKADLRRKAADRLASVLIKRQPDRLSLWSGEQLSDFIFRKSYDAEQFGLVSRADVQCFIETILLISPSLELAREFREITASAPNPNARMLHFLSTSDPGVLSHLTVSDAPETWHKHLFAK